MIQTNKIYQGDSLEILETWPDDFIQMVCTSPPYWGLRDYGVEGQIGLESTPDKYVQKIVEVFREVRRILKKDGTLWLNLGDSYAGSWGDYVAPGSTKHGSKQSTNRWQRPGYEVDKHHSKPPTANCTDYGLKKKDLVGIPWRVAFALQSDGWYLRSDIIWSKPNAMPESVTDHPTRSHEYIFLLSKSRRYFYDAEAIKEKAVYGFPNSPDSISSPYAQNIAKRKRLCGEGNDFAKHSGNKKADGTNFGEFKNKRSVWKIPTSQFKEAHFATFPEKLIEPCILAGSRPDDIVLEPFMGSGTVGVVAKRFKRQWLGIELNPKYIEMANRRINREQEPLLVEGVV